MDDKHIVTFVRNLLELAQLSASPLNQGKQNVVCARNIHSVIKQLRKFSQRKFNISVSIQRFQYSYKNHIRATNVPDD